MAQIDQALAAQIEAIIHQPTFRALERIWRSLDFLCQKVDFAENILIQILSVSQKDLLEDFLDSPEITQSGLYRLAYVAEYGQFGGQPLGAIICEYEITNAPDDYKLLARAAEVGAATHAPFLFPVGPKFFGLNSFADLDNARDLADIFRQKNYQRWRSLRTDENSRYLALCWPGFALRRPYAPESVYSFSYAEKAVLPETDYLWGSGTYLVALAMAQSFAQFRWGVSMIEENGGGLIKGLLSLPTPAMGYNRPRICLNYLVSEKNETILAEEGLISLSLTREPGEALIVSANSVLAPKTFGPSEGGEEASLSHRLSTKLPYMTIINRLAHYIKVLQRENIGGWKGASALETELNKWLNQFITDMDNPEPLARGRHPLRRGRVMVRPEPSRPGWYRVNLTVRPHYKLLGANFDLSLTGRLEKMEWGQSPAS
jgi:type VI secretion system protein ImpC